METRARIATGFRATIQSLGWIGMEAGIFERLELDVSFPAVETGGPEAAAGLARGHWEFAEMGTASLLESVLPGDEAVLLPPPTVPSQTAVPHPPPPSLSPPPPPPRPPLAPP